MYCSVTVVLVLEGFFGFFAFFFPLSMGAFIVKQIFWEHLYFRFARVSVWFRM